jgi:hypothetical protein
MISMTQKSVEQVSRVFEVVAPIDHQLIASSPVFPPLLHTDSDAQLHLLTHSEALGPTTHNSHRQRERNRKDENQLHRHRERIGKDESVESLQGLIYIITFASRFQTSFQRIF